MSEYGVEIPNVVGMPPITAPPEEPHLPPRQWLKKNLFSSVFNTLLTIVTIYVVYIAVKGLWVWGIADAVWVADSRLECFDISVDGACWAGIHAPRLFTVETSHVNMVDHWYVAHHSWANRYHSAIMGTHRNIILVFACCLTGQAADTKG